MTAGTDITADAPLLLDDGGPVLAPLPEIGLGDARDIVFAIEFARTGDSMIAVIKSGHEVEGLSLSQTAERLLARKDMQRAIEAARRQDALMRVAEVGHETTAAMALDLYEDARRQNRLSDAKNALTLLAQLKGYLVERKEIHHRVAADQLSDEELMEIIKRDKSKMIEGEFTEVGEDGAQG